MTQPAGDERGENPPLYPVGCAGRIVAFSESEDSRYRYLITLVGVCRFDRRGNRGRARVPARARRLEPLARRSRAAGPVRDGPRTLPQDAQGLLRRQRHLGRLGGDRRRARRPADHHAGDGLPVLARREAGAARGRGRRRPRAGGDGADGDGRARRRRRRPAAALRRGTGMAAEIDPKLLELLVCPVTKQALSYDRERQELVSKAAGLAFPIRDGIPIMLVDEARKLEE